MSTPVDTRLWTDWCAVVGADPLRRDPGTLQTFADQAGPSRRLLKALAPAPQPEPAPAWPHQMRASDGSLRQVLRHAAHLAEHPHTYWVDRLRLRRLRFAAVLLAPTDGGGLGLNRRQVHLLDPATLEKLRPSLTPDENPRDCASCAVWSWLHVLGTTDGWSHASVRELANRPDPLEKKDHRHTRQDPSPEWRCRPRVLPGIDRWGHLELYGSLHPSSISVLVADLESLFHQPAPPPPPTTPDPDDDRAPTHRVFSDDEREQVFARADELNARITAILAEYG